MAREVKSLPISKLKSMPDGKVTVGTVLSNQEITSGFYWKEVGIYALDPDNNTEILYCYGYAQAPEYIPAGTNSADVIEKIVDLIIVVGTGATVTASIEKSLIYETIEESDNKISVVQTDLNNHKNNKNNPHAVTKAQVELGNVDNVQQATKAEFNSHNGDNTRHITAAERTKWNSGQLTKITNDDGTFNLKAYNSTDDIYQLFLSAPRGMHTFYCSSVAKNKLPNGQVIKGIAFIDSQGQWANIIGIADNREIWTNSINSGTVSGWVKQETSDGAQAKVDAHANRKDNPHNVTSEQINKAVYRIASIPGTSYSKGVTVSSTSTGIQDGYPYDLCIVMTVNDDINRIFQYAILSDAGTNKVSFRNYRDAEKKWSGWSEIETTAGAQEKANQAKNDAINFAKSFGLGTICKDISNSDVNNLNNSGFYKGNQLINRPPRVDGDNTGIWHYVIHMEHDSTGWKSQIAIEYDTGTMFIRIKNNGVWGSWKQQETIIGAQAKADTAKNQAVDWVRNYGLGGTSYRLNPNTDLNNIANNGWYDVQNPTNGVSGLTWHKLLVINSGDGSNNWITQIAFSMTENKNEMYTRQRTNGSWSGWEKLAKDSEVYRNRGDVATGDLNNYTTIGSYRIDANAKAIVNFPPDAYKWGTLMVHPSSDGCSQIFAPDVENEGIYFRTKYAASSSWRPWKRLETTEGSQAKAANAKQEAINFAQSFGLGTTLNSPLSDMSNLDLNSPTGFYMTDASTTNKPISGTGGAIIHINRQNRPVQYYIDYSTSKFFTRSYNGSAWSAWAENESTTGAQTKADTAKNAAIDWVKSFGLGTDARMWEEDLNNIIQTGFYRITNKPNIPPSRSGNPGNWFYVIHIQHDPSWSKQIAYEYGTNYTWTREKKNGSWQSWSEYESTSGAQAKATQAKNDAISWAKSFGLGDAETTLNSIDLNTVRNNGFYFVTGSCANAPTSNFWGALTVSGKNSAECNQFLTNYIDKKIYNRSYTIGGGWSSWSEIETTVGSQARVNAVQVGGRNYVIGTAKPVTATGTGGVNQCTNLYDVNFSDLAGKQVTLSFDIVSTATTGTAILQWNNTPWGTFNAATTVSTTKKRISVVSTQPGSGTAVGINIRLDNVTGTVTISNLKLEIGNKATDWCPAIEDVEADAQAKANQAEQNAKNASVSKYGDTMSGVLTVGGFANNAALARLATNGAGALKGGVGTDDVWIGSDKAVTVLKIKDNNRLDWLGPADLQQVYTEKVTLSNGPTITKDENNALVVSSSVRTVGGATFTDNVWTRSIYGTWDYDFYVALREGELRVTDQLLWNGNYKPVRAAVFHVSSSEKYKTRISLYEEKALELIENTDIYSYVLKNDWNSGNFKQRIGVIIERNTPEEIVDGDGIDQYTMITLSWKAIQEMSQKLQEQEQKITAQEQKIATLESKIEQYDQVITQLKEKGVIS
ncbi:hypothetical protein [Niallia sp. 03190]|uniref:hypothetical protein n=1 Tax=Niallia sp. 03190 TaxID=3458061 RepID=UPI004043E953